MKLIDLLVQELPKRGGWPNCACVAKSYSHIPDAIFWDDNGITVPFHSLSRLPIGDYCVTREQYEAALAASTQPEWNGEGLPPVGCECELVNFFGEDFPEFAGESGEKVRIIGNGYTNGCPVAFYEADGGRGNVLAYAVAPCFRPIRSEAERKRDQAIAQMMERSAVLVEATAALIYDAIAAGKIPGVKLAD